ncbi:MAG: lysylphosphatidylglycerol synthase transmembrane domain-containing protein [Ferruginibacter sp.]
MRKKIVFIFQYLLFLGAGIFLVWWQFTSMNAADKKEFYLALSNTNYFLLLPVVVMSLLSHLSRAMRWKLMMDPLGYKPALKNVFAVTMVGYFANSAIPRLGEVLKCSLLAKFEKLKIDKLFGTILVERTFDFICYLLFIGITVLLQIDLIGSYVSEKLTAMNSGEGMPVLLKISIGMLLILGTIFLLKWLVNKFPQHRIIGKLNGFVSGIGAGFKTIRSMKKRRLFLLHTCFIWTMYLLQVYIGFYAMEATNGLSILAAFSVLSLSTLAMIATPGGMGSFPVFVAQTLLIYGVATPQGKAFGWLLWGANTIIVVIIGLIALLLLPYLNKHKQTYTASATNEAT